MFHPFMFISIYTNALLTFCINDLMHLIMLMKLAFCKIVIYLFFLVKLAYAKVVSSVLACCGWLPECFCLGAKG